MSGDVSKGRPGIIVTSYRCGVNESYQTRQTADYLFIINFCPVDVEKIRFDMGFLKNIPNRRKKVVPVKFILCRGGCSNVIEEMSGCHFMMTYQSLKYPEVRLKWHRFHRLTFLKIEKQSIISFLSRQLLIGSFQNIF